jgi:lysozyme family protein
MTNRFLLFVEFLIEKLEGGAKIITDTGGLTKYGISQKGNPSVDIANLTKNDAIQIYREKYWNEFIEKLPAKTAFVYFDTLVNSPPDVPVKLLQTALNRIYKTNLKEDGILGEKTKNCSQVLTGTCSDCEVSNLMLFLRIQRYIDLAKQEKYKSSFMGWISRCCTVNDFIIQLKYNL